VLVSNELAVARPAVGRQRAAAKPAGGLLQWLLEGPGWTILQPAADLVLVSAATAVAVGGIQATSSASAVRAPLLVLPLFTVLLLYSRGLYRTRLRALFLDTVAPAVGAVSVAVMGVVMLGLLVNGRAPNQLDLLRAWLLAVLAVGAGRMILSVSQSWARRRRVIGRPVLILGAGVVGSQMAQRLQHHAEYGLRPVGFIDDRPHSLVDLGDCDVPVVGTLDDVDKIVARTGVAHLIVAFASVTDSRVSPLVQRCQELGVEVSVVPRMFDTINDRVRYDAVGGMPLLSFSSVSPRGGRFALKHGLDRVLAAFLLLALAPVLACVALAVRLSSPGPVLFRQRRVGRDGVPFDLYKYRSMREPAALPSTAEDAGTSDSTEPFAAAADEQPGRASAHEGARVAWLGGDTAPGGREGVDRLTAVGRVMRRLGLDELPQLLNVLRGEMSLVGPRPERPEFVELFRQELARYGDRHRVKSGITGWAQVHGLRGNTSLAERVEWDNYYIAHWSFGLDLKILLLTVLVLLRGESGS
jgi:exopolysaccharide biosynthesis polyprenyl glycosylphosphotransferase